MTDPMAYAQAIAALVGVLILLWVLALVLKRYAGNGARRWGRSKRLGLVEVLPIDSKRRVVLIRRDDQEHLLLIGGEHDLLVSTHDAPPEAPRPRKAARKGGDDDFDATLASLSVDKDKREPTL
ncbi:FliO/MopB family protein [Lacibacterium aquatile]|uniref:FliO/MopB family protein n=1 Tax=Lacibacterium aquatile TaxID=1168082 RepID=A0ABW5DR39_9PROT